MIVGRKVINSERLQVVYDDPQSLEKYCLSLIPKYARHLPNILDNQKYVVALAIRKEKSISFKKKKEICDRLLEGTTVRGYLHAITEVEDLIFHSDIDKLLSNLFKEELSYVP